MIEHPARLIKQLDVRLDKYLTGFSPTDVRFSDETLHLHKNEVRHLVSYKHFDADKTRLLRLLSLQMRQQTKPGLS